MRIVKPGNRRERSWGAAGGWVREGLCADAIPEFGPRGMRSQSRLEQESRGQWEAGVLRSSRRPRRPGRKWADVGTTVRNEAAEGAWGLRAKARAWASPPM